MNEIIAANENETNIAIQLSPARRIPVLVFQGLSLLFLGVLWFSMFRDSDINTFRGYYKLATWAFATGSVLFWLCVEVFGTDCIELSPTGLMVQTDYLVWTRTKDFDLPLIKYVRVVPPNYRVGNTFEVGQGRLRFEYENKTYDVGAALTEEQAEDLLRRI